MGIEGMKKSRGKKGFLSYGWIVCLALLSGWASQLRGDIVLSKAEQEFLKKHPVITFVSQENYPPFEFLDTDGQSTGICVELVRWMGAEIGFTPRFTHTNLLEAQKNVLLGHADVLTSLFYSEERKSRFDFTEVIVNVPASIFVPVSTPDIENGEHLTNKIIAMQRGDYAEEFLKKNKIPVRIVYSKDFAGALELVLKGKAEAMIGDEQIVLFEATGAKLNAKFKIVGKPLYEGSNCMAVKRGNEVLLEILNKGIHEAKKRGIFDQIYRKWLGTNPVSEESFFERKRSEIIFVAVLLVVVLLIVAGWNIQLRMMVSLRTMEVKKRESAYRALTENSMDLIIRHDQSLQIIYVNLAAARFVDNRVRDLHNVTLHQAGFTLEMAKEWEEGIREVFTTNRARRLLLESYSGKDKLWLDCRLVPEFGAQNQVETVLSTCRDITETKKAEEDRRILELQMQQAQKLESLGVMAGGIAHDFNNLLTIIRGNAELALMEVSQDAPSRPFLLSIDETTQRAADLCSQLLAYTGKAKFVTKSIDLNALLHETMDLLVVSLAKRASLDLRLKDRLPLIEGDQTQIQQILMNLVLNAAEAVEEKHGIVVIETGFENCETSFIQNISAGSTLTSGTYVYFKILDNGCGMSEQTMSRIFDPFFTTKFTGRGLGLAAVLGIVKSHSGFLRALSTFGEGSEFTVWLPTIENQTPGVKIVGNVIQQAWRGKGMILLADDEISVQRVTRRLLEKAGFDVIVAANGKEAVELFTQHRQKFVLVLLDLTMPVMDGIEAMRKMREIQPDIKVILSSGYHELEAKALLKTNEQPRAFLEKPYSFNDLLKTLRMAIEE